jgi:outer membrane biosynthesis protein TonB
VASTAADAVSRVLEARGARHGHRAEVLGLLLAAGLHLAVAVLAVALPALLHREARTLELARVRLVPQAVLGVRNPSPQRAPAPAPEPAAPAPPPQQPKPVEPEKPRIEPEKPAARLPPPDAKPAPKPPERSATRPPPPAPPTAPSPPAAGDGPGRQGAPGGSPEGTSALGGRVGLDDPNFRYDYYLERILALIDGQWQRPETAAAIEAAVRFRIEADGRVVDITLAQESGNGAFDLAAGGAEVLAAAAAAPRLPQGHPGHLPDLPLDGKDP